MSRKDYQLIAETLKSRKPDEIYLLGFHPSNVVDALVIEWENMVCSFSNMLSKENELFQQAKFFKACGVTNPHLGTMA